MNTKLAGGILLIVGTSIGGGMLALPVTTAASGFLYSSLLLMACWVVMTFAAFLILEVNLWLPARSNMITMARETLGRPGVIFAWASYIFLLYSLLAAYISGGSALFHDLLKGLGINSSNTVDSSLFVLLLGYLVYRGIQPVDYVNRGLMTLKLGTLFILIFLTFPYLDEKKLMGGNPYELTLAVTVMMTSFGFATIIPSLRSYFNSDIKKLRLAILIGSLIPLICYLIWDFAILGTLPREGENGLIKIMQQGGSVTELTNSLGYYLHNTSVTRLSHVFTTICVLTSFLGVSLGLSDFLADGFRLEKVQKGRLLVTLATFLPPLSIVLFYPSIFVKALSYAGIFVVMLVVLLPALMVWSGRYRKQFDTSRYEVWGGKLSILMLIVVGLGIIGLGLVT